MIYISRQIVCNIARKFSIVLLCGISNSDSWAVDQGIVSGRLSTSHKDEPVGTNSGAIPEAPGSAHSANTANNEINSKRSSKVVTIEDAAAALRAAKGQCEELLKNQDQVFYGTIWFHKEKKIKERNAAFPNFGSYNYEHIRNVVRCKTVTAKASYAVRRFDAGKSNALRTQAKRELLRINEVVGVASLFLKDPPILQKGEMELLSAIASVCQEERPVDEQDVLQEVADCIGAEKRIDTLISLNQGTHDILKLREKFPEAKCNAAREKASKFEGTKFLDTSNVQCVDESS